jgi:hypothetical protein
MIKENILKNFNTFKDPVIDLRKKKTLILREYKNKIEGIEYLQKLKRPYKKPKKA